MKSGDANYANSPSLPQIATPRFRRPLFSRMLSRRNYAIMMLRTWRDATCARLTPSRRRRLISLCSIHNARPPAEHRKKRTIHVRAQQNHMNSIPTHIQETLQRFSQVHVLQFWPTLPDAKRQTLLAQLSATDFAQLHAIWLKARADSVGTDTSADRIAQAAAPKSVVRQPQSAEDFTDWKSATEQGVAELQSGRVAVITVAGGQGTRLGFNHPKGMFPIGPVSDRTLFQIFAEQIFARRRRHAAVLPWFIMTSDATHAETVAFFQENDYFGLPQDSIAFFQQGSLPAIDAATGNILLSGQGELALSPDGHGGLIMALQHAGLLKRMEREGIEHVFYHQVDNPTAIIADPALIGFHHQQRSLMTTNVVCKSSPTERMGVLVDVNGHTEIIEYSELTPTQAASCNADGQWIFWAGNTAIHVFDRAFLQRMTEDGRGLPLHVARKNVAYVDDQGQMVQPTDAAHPNAYKLERFIFDALPLAERTLIVEGNRAREFNPVKNAAGADSAETSRAALNRIAREWLTAAGCTIRNAQPVEISPLQALDAEELRSRLAAGSIRVEDLLFP